MAANIRADGYRLLQNLVVRKGDKKGRYFAVAGGRRLAALTVGRRARSPRMPLCIALRRGGAGA
ncbi:ParB N-terminal domain-containing protein [Sinorhizobium meliloti]|uniref:ParB N-terminal domain-containing protein n=1 Tax=Rhizobium meliloti TaxID=382 RepID=UPI001F188493|nr:ParB N-terminal domain-containing protein [Sinorhizobium meliloti]